MTPPARLSAAIEVLDRILTGSNAEQVLTNWGRANRYAGSGDRAGIRDLVYDALRCKRSFAALGGSMTGRGLVLGGVRASGIDVEGLFTGEGHAPAVIGPADEGRIPHLLEALDCPDWLAQRLIDSLGDDFAAVMQALRRRAGVYLRVNSGKVTVAQAQTSLAAEGIATVPADLASTAIEVIENERKVQNSNAYANGLVELQDAASQAVVEALYLRDGMKVLDYCAGGGGKALAIAAKATVSVFAHDADPRRMRDLPARAKRAGAKISILESITSSSAYDLVLTDVPCSGSGSWRRDPQGKWTLTAERLAALTSLQAEILDRAAPLVTSKGDLAYVTCSVLKEEDEAQIEAFLSRHKGWEVHLQHRYSPLQGGDGFFVAILRRIV